MKDGRCGGGNYWGRKRLLETIDFFFCHQRKHLPMRLLTTTMRSMTENLKFLTITMGLLTTTMRSMTENLKFSTITMRAGGKLKPI